MAQPRCNGATLRLHHYVDLTDGAQRSGLDQPSLWDGAGDSWHGKMTTVIAAGNGLLSHGRFRGYAPARTILPIKIGRSDGRIPEEDILRGLEWLLAADRWRRHDVRVLNVSVGGDFRAGLARQPGLSGCGGTGRRGVCRCRRGGQQRTRRACWPRRRRPPC